MLRRGVQIGKKKEKDGEREEGRKSKTFYENFTLLFQTYILYSKQRFIAEMRKGVYMLNVLVVCEESQAVCKAFRELGHSAFSLDLQECSGGKPEWHIVADAIEFLEYCKEEKTYIDFRTQDKSYYTVPHWDIIIAHPPCTYLTKASATSMFPGGKLNLNRFSKMQVARDFFMYLYNYNVKYLCIENPIPLSICNLPKASQEINPCLFGADFSKRTYLWLKNLPPLFSTSYCINPRPFLTAVGHSAKERSKTYPGIAKAMALQWGVYCNV